MKKLLCSMLVVVLVFAGCSSGGDKAEVESETSQSETEIASESSESESSSESEESQSMDDLLDENQKLLDEMEPIAQSMQENLDFLLDDKYKNDWYICDVTVWERDVFAANIQLDVGTDSIVGADSIFASYLSGMESALRVENAVGGGDAKFTSLTLTLVNNGEPLIIIIKNIGEDGYTLFRDGKREEVESIEGIGVEQATVPPEPETTTTAPTATQPNVESEPETNVVDTVYWTPGGGSYHSTSSCRTLARSKTINSGTLSQALAAGKTDPCNVCAGG